MGRVRSRISRGKRTADEPMILAQHVNSPTSPYYAVNLYGNGKNHKCLVHRLVAEAFHGKAPAGMMVRHLDGNSFNNRADNLAWGTAKENAADSMAHGTAFITGQGRVEAVLTDEEVYDVWKRAQEGEPALQIHKDYSHVSYATIRFIVSGKSRKKTVQQMAAAAAQEAA
jgi:hypothetical protein